MNKLFRKILSIPHYLVSQLFIYFSFVFILIVCSTLMIRSLDTRQIMPLFDSDISFLTQEGIKLQKNYNLDEIFERDLAVQTPEGMDLILVEKNSDIVSGMTKSNIKQFLSFLYQSEGFSRPMTRSFDGMRINGPIPIVTEKREYNAYFLYPVITQSKWFNELLDDPFILMQVLVIFGLPTILFLSWYITRPVKELRLTANAVARGSLIPNERIENQGIQEFREVGKSLNQMIRSLQNSTLRQQRLLSDISHELKTPLARLQLATAILKKKVGENKETERIECEIEKMNLMVLDLLAISRQQIDQHLDHVIFPINEIWQNVLSDTAFEAEQKRITLTIEFRIARPENYYMNGNPATLASALENIIRNAQKYAQSKIKVAAHIEHEDEKGWLIMSVDDDGHGVPESELDKIFRPFYRVDEARTRQTGGTGLGLSIVENAIIQHKGIVTALRSNMGGLRIEFKLPLWNN